MGVGVAALGRGAVMPPMLVVMLGHFDLTNDGRPCLLGAEGRSGLAFNAAYDIADDLVDLLGG